MALALSTLAAHAVNDEIQVYNAEIAKVGQWTLQQHLNYAINGRKEPDFDGGIIPNHALNGTPELSYGITEWWEIGFYAPFAVDHAGEFSSNAGKIRQLFVTPNAAKREFFYGVNFEFSYATARFAETQLNLEIRPIIGVRKNNYEFIVNPIVDVGFGSNADAIFAPAARVARNFGENFALGIEYYTDLGPLRNFLPFNEQQHNIYAVTDFKIGRFDCKCRHRLWPHSGLGPCDGEDDHRHRAQCGGPGQIERAAEAHPQTKLFDEQPSSIGRDHECGHDAARILRSSRSSTSRPLRSFALTFPLTLPGRADEVIE